MESIKILGSISPYCKNNSNCPGYMIIENDKKILLDCGAGITRNMNMPNDLNNLVIIISHYHKDHYIDIFSIGYASFCYYKMGLLKEKIKLYIPEVNKGDPGYDDYVLINNFKEQYFDIQTYNKYSKIKLDNNIITFFETKHSITNYSCKVQNGNNIVVYTGDMGYQNINEYILFCKNASILISESTYLEIDDKKDDNHLHTKEAAKIALLANTKILLLTHFWPEHKKEEYLEEAKTIFKNTLVAVESLVIDLTKNY